MTRCRWHLVVALTLAFLFLVASSFAATQNAVVYGTVYDASGNPMPGATVNLENATFGFARSTVTGSDGSFNFAEVPPAEGYTVTALRSGKTIDKRTGLSVNVGDERVVLPPLREQVVAATPAGKKGGEAPTQSATENAVNLETVSTMISGVITREQLLALPLYNRNFLALGLITPNTHDAEAGSSLAGASFSVAGQRVSSNNFLLDGVDNVASSSNQAVPFQVNDSIQEFRVVSSTATAEYGRNQGGVVNVVTRRGGNQFHGSAFGYFGSDVLNADNAVSVYNGTTFDQAAAYAGSLNSAPLAATTNVPASPLTYNQYVATAAANGFCTNSISATATAGSHACATGGFGQNALFDPASILATNNNFAQPFSSQQFGANIGGPIKKDKWFIFGSYEGTLINNPNPIFERVPSAFDKTYNPLGAVPGTVAPTYASTDANYTLAQNILGLYPAANVVAVPGVLEFFRGEAPNYTHVHNFLARTDYKQSDTSTWNVRYVLQDLNQLHDDTLPKTSVYPGNGAVRDALNQNLSIGFSHNFSSTVINDARAGYNRFNVEETPQDAKFDATSIGLPYSAMETFILSGLDPQYSGASNGINGAFAGYGDTFWQGGVGAGQNAVMNPSLDFLFPFARLGAPLNAPSQRIDTTWYLTDNLSWSRGKHSFKFGAEFRHLGNEITQGGFSRGFVVSGDVGQFHSDSESCNQACVGAFGVSDGFFSPSFAYAQRQPTQYGGTFNSFAIGMYAQDTWRIAPRFVVNVGLRYEYFSPPQVDNGQLFNFDPNANGLVEQGTTGPVLDPFGFPCGNPTFYNAQPNSLNFFGPAGRLDWSTCSPLGNGHIGATNYYDYAPRAGVAWDVAGNGRTVIRAGFGLFYDQLPVNDYAQLLYNRPTSISGPNAIYGENFNLFATGPTYCYYQCGVGITTLNPAVTTVPGKVGGTVAVSPLQAAAMPFALYSINPHDFSTPYSYQMNATIQQQVTSKMTIEAGYIGARGQRLPVLSNINFTNQFFNTFQDNVALFPAFQLSNAGSSDYDSLMIRVRTAGWHGLRMNATYNYSHSHDNASSSVFPLLPTTAFNQLFGYQLDGLANPAFGGGGFTGSGNVVNFDTALTTTGAGQVFVSHYGIPQDPLNYLHNDWGRSDFDVPHRLALDYMWDVPSLQKAFGWSKWLDNWELSGIFIAQSGQPFTVFSSVLGEFTQRANLVSPVYVGSDPVASLNPNAVQIAALNCGLSGTTIAQPSCNGNTFRNQFRGPHYVTMNFALQKGFPIGGESHMLALRAEFYNLFNDSNFYNPISLLSVDGSTVNPNYGQIKSAHDPREIQFGVRYTW